jgi:hypothetical protein
MRNRVRKDVAESNFRFHPTIIALKNFSICDADYRPAKSSESVIRAA